MRRLNLVSVTVTVIISYFAVTAARLGPSAVPSVILACLGRLPENMFVSDACANRSAVRRCVLEG